MVVLSIYLKRQYFKDGSSPANANTLCRSLAARLRLICLVSILTAVPAVRADDAVSTQSKFNVPVENHTSAVSGDTNANGGFIPETASLENRNTGTTRNPRDDYDGDGRSDLSVFRSLDATWYLDRTTAGFSTVRFGLSDDELVPADFDGDGKTDIAVYRDGEWWWIASATNTVHLVHFGLSEDTPVPADYTGDGRAEIAVYRLADYWEGQWFIRDLATGETRFESFGMFYFMPVVSDYDGDGTADIAMLRKCGPESELWYLRSTDNSLRVQDSGNRSSGWVVVPADYTGDGKTDIAYWHPLSGKWTIYRSEDNSYFSFQFGMEGDLPAPADYDGDRIADVAVFRTSTRTWWIDLSGGGIIARQFGFGGDIPVRTVFTYDPSGVGCWDY